MSLNGILSVCVGRGSICIVAIASKMIQSADCIETIVFSSKLSTLRIKSDFVHEIIDPSSLNIIKGTGAFSKDNTRSRGTF